MVTFLDFTQMLQALRQLHRSLSMQHPKDNVIAFGRKSYREYDRGDRRTATKHEHENEHEHENSGSVKKEAAASLPTVYPSTEIETDRCVSVLCRSGVRQDALVK
eukprot:3882081-Pyramimonas_sp.AAC.1